MAKKQSLDDMRDEAYRRQDNLAADIDELVDRVNPKNAITRWKNELVDSVKGFTEAADEKSPVSLPVAIAGGVAGLVVIGAGVAGLSALSRHRARQKQPSVRLEKAIIRAGKDAEKAIRGVSKSAEASRKQAAKKVESTRKQASKSADAARKQAAKKLEKTVEAVRG